MLSAAITCTCCISSASVIAGESGPVPLEQERNSGIKKKKGRWFRSQRQTRADRRGLENHGVEESRKLEWLRAMVSVPL
jgi:hypothetical protein